MALLAKRITGPPVSKSLVELEEAVLRISILPQLIQLDLKNPLKRDIILETGEPHTCGTYQIQLNIGSERIECAGETQFPKSYDQKKVIMLIVSGVLTSHERATFLLLRAKQSGKIQVSLEKIMKTATIDRSEAHV